MLKSVSHTSSAHTSHPIFPGETSVSFLSLSSHLSLNEIYEPVTSGSPLYPHIMFLFYLQIINSEVRVPKKG
jgi:hypothetical protein